MTCRFTTERFWSKTPVMVWPDSGSRASVGTTTLYSVKSAGESASLSIT